MQVKDIRIHYYLHQLFIIEKFTLLNQSISAIQLEKIFCIENPEIKDSEGLNKANISLQKLKGL